MTLRACIYARYSSDLQSASSIEDQFRMCTEKAKSEGWIITDYYSDAAVSGSSLLRTGMQNLIDMSILGEFDILLAEGLDRLSRDQEDIAGLFKRMMFAGVKIITLSEGQITPLHIGLKGTMNSMQLEEIAYRTRRGLSGRILQGKSGGGLAYGYKVVKKLNSDGEDIRGDREIVEEQATIIRRVFEEYAYQNKSPKAIAAQLNEENIPAPSGRHWGQSTINGNRRRGTGLLNNHTYIGELIWNRQRFIKNPDTGRRVTRLNKESEWIRQSVPDLRIVPQELWDAAKAKQKELDKISGGFNRKKRPQYLLSGLLECGQCGGGFSKVNSERYGCSAARNKGESVCTNKQTIKRETLENLVLSALQTHLMRDDLVKVFCEEFTRHMNELQARHQQSLNNHTSEQAKLQKERENLITAIKGGIAPELVKDDLESVSKRLEELEELMKTQTKPRPILHPTMAENYRKIIKNLAEFLNQEDRRAEAHQHLRGLLEKIVLTPRADQDDLSIDLHGDLAGILKIASQENAMNNTSQKGKRLGKIAVNDNYSTEPSIQVVAGAGFEPTTFPG